jgi:26S proteasome regulatory subunit N5
MADAAFKPEKDYSKEADKQIPEAEELAKVPIATAAVFSSLGLLY